MLHILGGLQIDNMPDWEAEDIRNWKREVKEVQQDYCNLLGDRDYDEVPIENNLLKRKVGYAFFGVPNNAGNDDENDILGYDDEQCAIINSTCNKLRELQNNNNVINMSTTFVMCKIFEKKIVFPVIRGYNVQNNTYHFIDMSLRIYENWQDFLSNNKLPKCIYCYTSNGYYHTDENDNVQVGFGTSPACDLKSRTAEVLDYSGMAVGIGCTVVGLASLFVPVVGPITAAALYSGVTTGVYGIGRSANALYDRGTHGQSIGLEDSESRNCWLGIVGGSLCFGAMGSMGYIANAASKGYVVGQVGRVFANTMQISSLTMNGLGILNSTIHMTEKLEKNELTTLDVFQFTTSILFFSNSVLSMKTATSVIKETQANVIKDYKSGLEGRSAKNAFAKLARKTRGKDGMYGNARVIRSIRNIDNPKEFFGSLTAIQKDIRGHNVKLTENGLVNVNREFIAHPTKLVQIPEEMRKQIFTATKNLSFSNKLSQENFKIQMASICRSQRIAFEFQRNATRQNLATAFGVNDIKDIKINGKRIFADLKPFEIDRLGAVMENTAKGYNADLLKISVKFAELQEVSGVTDFASFTEFACDFINKEISAKENHYQHEKRNAPNLAQHDFDRNYGIPDGMKRKNHFFNETVNELQTDTSNEGSKMNIMKQLFNQLKNEVTPENRSNNPCFLFDSAATYHYSKHKNDFPGETMSVADYFNLASELTGQDISAGNSILSQEGDTTFVTFCNGDGAKAVLVMKHAPRGEHISGIATLMYDRTASRNN
ncbi:hypothetical protein B566_EDAN016532 [Ephemera danica]|nr:hypothetical protein B566_EDAN016532 [Ephemera danica]